MGKIKTYPSLEELNDVSWAGAFTVTKQNSAGKIMSQETVHNDIVDATRNKFVGALINESYDWDSTSTSGVRLNFDDPDARNALSFPKACADLGGGGGSSNVYVVAIAIETKTDNDIAMCKSTSTYNLGATSSGNVISYGASITNISGTNIFDYARLGIIDDFIHTGSGTIIWLNEWANGTFTEVSIESTDVLTVDWTITIG